MPSDQKGRNLPHRYRHMKFINLHEAILNSMSEAVYVVDRDMEILYSNPAAERLTGFSSQESAGKVCHEIFCERSELCGGKCSPKRVMQEQTPILHREAETRTKAGDVRQTQVSISPFYEKGECVGAVLIINDITDLKVAEEKIQKQNAFLTAVIDALPHPFTVVDAATYRLKLANSAAYQGKLPENMTCHKLSHHRDTPCLGTEHPCPFEKVRETGRPAIVEHMHYSTDGTCRDVEVHCFPIFDDRGKLVQFIEYCIDISERKQTTAEREKLIVDLQKAVDDVKTLEGLLPMCAGCKKIRDEKGCWNTIESYLVKHTDAEFTHGLCPDCITRLYPDYTNSKKRGGGKK
jgi:PAS domain S-box-containing protein